MVLLGSSPEDLQRSFNKLYDYCDLWGLEVNTEKTKVVVFRKRGRVRENEKWEYDKCALEVADDFNYLGVVFNYTGSFCLNQQTVCGKALKALNVLTNNIKKFELCPKSSLQLFDAFVASILNYSCEVWGITKSKEIERIHLKFCKYILGVKIRSSNVGIYGELGRYPLYINRFARAIKYWLKLSSTQNIILNAVYKDMLVNCEKGIRNWLFKIKTILSSHGLLYIWNDPHCLDHNYNCSSNVELVILRKAGEPILITTECNHYKEVKPEFGYAKLSR